MYSSKMKFLIFLYSFGIVCSQRSPLRQLQMANMLQTRNNLLQQAMLQNLRNPAVSQGATPSVSQSVRLVNQLNRMTQNMMNNLNGGTRAAAPSLGANNLIPVDVLLRQQRNLQAQMLQNMQNTQNVNSNIPITQNTGFNQNPNVNTQSTQQTTGTNDVTVVVVPRNNTTFQNVQTGNSNIPQTSDVNPFTASTGNTTFEDIFTNFGGFSFPSTSADFWTGRTDAIGSSTGSNRQPTDVPSSIVPSTGGFTNLNNRQTTGQRTTFDPATGITFGSGFTVDQQTNSGTDSNTGVNTRTGGTTFGRGTISEVGSTFDTSQSSSGSTIGGGISTAPQTFGINLPGGFRSNQPTTVGAGTSSGATSMNTGGTTGTRQPAIAPDALSCTEEYQKIPGHTLCMTDSSLLTKAGVNIDDRLRITQIHNSLRASVQPPAADLVSLQWDDRVAAVAQKWAKQCKLAHDTERTVPEMGMSFGQNVAVGFETWPEAIQMWYDEISVYRYGLEPDSYLGKDGWRQIAHFTQIVQNGTYLIGCGYAECPETQYVRYYVCNYAAGQTDLAYPYTAGLRCESCPNNCINGLCDCGGLVCYNGGTLDESSCKCECSKPYTGERCEIIDCPVSDNWICGRDWPPSYCERFYNVPEECPYMCGICGDGTAITNVVTTPNITTFTSSFGCRYTGVRDDEASCRNYGENGNDMRMCSSQGGTVGCGECDRYFNIKRDYCPVMCGLCDPPCAGKRCSNGGTLDTNTCACSCRKPFTGDTCEFAQCPINGDPGFCRFWPPRYCQMYYNVPEECPYMCGICKTENAQVSVMGTPERRGQPLNNPVINTRARPKRLTDAAETRRKR
ncbi:uncharacterized protein LOC123526325 [Mercenaria mercenaria]|uniref:uncharacterized protein LOC123526325 n=1 Tax=Mercenaria mercenaria TaxID=6596 RepID=UPI00234F7073|nr:uncharacterized protein LOC123526325 [Mercenaria mercenaria]